jgi:hypothetical protein
MEFEFKCGNIGQIPSYFPVGVFKFLAKLQAKGMNEITMLS